MNWKDYFAMMVDWKKLPAYRAEPRIDSFIGFLLPELATKFLKDKIIGIIPELPMRLGTINPEKYKGTNFADRSYKVDFYLLGASGNNYFVELETDSSSISPKQNNYLYLLEKKGMEKIINGIQKIASVSPYIVKYNHLLDKLRDLKLLDSKGNFIGKSDKIIVIRIQPNNTKGDPHCIDFKYISHWLKNNNGIEEFEAELSEALLKWSND
jgi:hypothetical protein